MGLCAVLFAPAHGAPPIEDILGELRRNHDKLKVLFIEGSTKKYERDSMDSSWRVAPETSTFSLVIENKKRGWYVLEMKPSITRWEKGAAPCAAMWSTEFRDSDGFTTYWSKVFQHHDGLKLLPERSERNSASRRKESVNSYSWAETFLSAFSFSGRTALHFFDGVPVEMFSQLRKQLIEQTGLTVSDDEAGLVRVSYNNYLPNETQTHEVILDPAKGFGLVRYTRTGKSAGRKDHTRTYEVLEHRKIAGDIWYPVHCADTYDGIIKNELLLSQVSIREEGSLDRELTVKLPDGLEVKTWNAGPQ